MWVNRTLVVPCAIVTALGAGSSFTTANLTANTWVNVMGLSGITLAITSNTPGLTSSPWSLSSNTLLYSGATQFVVVTLNFSVSSPVNTDTLLIALALNGTTTAISSTEGNICYARVNTLTSYSATHCLSLSSGNELSIIINPSTTRALTISRIALTVIGTIPG